MMAFAMILLAVFTIGGSLAIFASFLSGLALMGYSLRWLVRNVTNGPVEGRGQARRELVIAARVFGLALLIALVCEASWYLIAYIFPDVLHGNSF